MTRARREQVSLLDTPYYHCISRCVRRAFLCGQDAQSGHCFEHRRQWIVERLALLADVFAIDIAAYAIMSNHYHLVLHVHEARANSWTDDEVIERWLTLFSGPPLIRRHQLEEELTESEQAKVAEIVADWRERLSDLSWFMRCLNEHIARQANLEDGCTGRFWEGRFKCQALLDEQALLTCMAYVDLNPLRAELAATPEASDYTSVQQRVEETAEPVASDTAKPVLQPLSAAQQDIDNHAVPFALADYLELVDWTGRCQREDKRGYISERTPPILQRLFIDPTQWQRTMLPAGLRFQQAVGSVARLKQYALNQGRRWVQGMGVAQQLYCRSYR